MNEQRNINFNSFQDGENNFIQNSSPKEDFNNDNLDSNEYETMNYYNDVIQSNNQNQMDFMNNNNSNNPQNLDVENLAGMMKNLNIDYGNNFFPNSNVQNMNQIQDNITPQGGQNWGLRDDLYNLNPPGEGRPVRPLPRHPLLQHRSSGGHRRPRGRLRVRHPHRRQG